MLARCGSKKVWHWAHKGRRHYDHWWENETEWHRNWKNIFPTDWQEVPARDGTGELHIADIKTPHSLVLEFQHSAIKLDEVKNAQFSMTTSFGLSMETAVQLIVLNTIG